MSANRFGRLFTFTSFGESHGPAIGGIIDGCPAGLSIEIDFIQKEMARRRPGQSSITTQRNEDDKVEILSGVFEGLSTGAPIGFIIRNKDQVSVDYAHLKELYRPSHADYTFESKYGIRDYRGGGRSSARETAVRIVAGAIAKLLLRKLDVTVNAFVRQIGEIRLEKDFNELDLHSTESNEVRCPDHDTALRMINLIKEVQTKGDTLGGVIQCVARGVPAGLGEPVYDKLSARLASAMLSINAVKGFEIGSGFAAALKRGSEINDRFESAQGKVITSTNHSGGIQGGISNGMPIWFNVAFKPVSTLMQDQRTIDKKGEDVVFPGKGRHDPCVVPRAVAIVESMTAVVLADFLLLSRANRL